MINWIPRPCDEPEDRSSTDNVIEWLFLQCKYSISCQFIKGNIFAGIINSTTVDLLKYSAMNLGIHRIEL